MKQLLGWLLAIIGLALVVGAAVLPFSHGNLSPAAVIGRSAFFAFVGIASLNRGAALVRHGRVLEQLKAMGGNKEMLDTISTAQTLSASGFRDEAYTSLKQHGLNDNDIAQVLNCEPDSSIRQSKQHGYRLSDIWGECQPGRIYRDEFIETTYELPEFQDALSCPTCMFFIQVSVQGEPWCTSPNIPDIQDNYCRTFKAL